MAVIGNINISLAVKFYSLNCWSWRSPQDPASLCRCLSKLSLQDFLGRNEQRPEYPEKNLSPGAREKTSNKLNPHMASNPGHMGGSRVLSPLRHPWSPAPVVGRILSNFGVKKRRKWTILQKKKACPEPATSHTQKISLVLPRKLRRGWNSCTNSYS